MVYELNGSFQLARWLTVLAQAHAVQAVRLASSSSLTPELSYGSTGYSSPKLGFAELKKGRRLSYH